MYCVYAPKTLSANKWQWMSSSVCMCLCVLVMRCSPSTTYVVCAARLLWLKRWNVFLLWMSWMNIEQKRTEKKNERRKQGIELEASQRREWCVSYQSPASKCGEFNVRAKGEIVVENREQMAPYVCSLQRRYGSIYHRMRKNVQIVSLCVRYIHTHTPTHVRSYSIPCITKFPIMFLFHHEPHYFHCSLNDMWYRSHSRIRIPSNTKHPWAITDGYACVCVHLSACS